MWCHNILRYKKGITPHILQLDTITSGYVLLTANLVVMKKVNTDPILIVKIIEWWKFIDYFGLSIEAGPSKVVKKKVYIFSIYSVHTNPFICKAPYSKSLAEQIVYFFTMESMSVPTNKNISAEIAPNIYSALRDL